MTRLNLSPWLAIGLITLLGGCATRPVNPPITQADPSTGYRFEVRQARAREAGKEALVVLAFSGAARVPPPFPTGCWKSCDGRRLSTRMGGPFGCSTRST